HPLPRQERALVLRRRLGTPPQHDSLLGMRQAPGFSPRAWRYAVLSPVPRARRLMMSVLASSAKFRGLDFLTGPNECALVRVTVVVASRRSGGGSTGWPGERWRLESSTVIRRWHAPIGRGLVALSYCARSIFESPSPLSQGRPCPCAG